MRYCRGIDTPLGRMVATSDKKVLCCLEFGECEGRDDAPPLISIERELGLYFSGKLREFKTLIAYVGTPFQVMVWKELGKIAFGETCSYRELAKKVKRDTACRAVAQANGRNRLAIVIPCHRVIYADGTLGGYAGGVEYKKGLLDHEMFWRG